VDQWVLIEVDRAGVERSAGGAAAAGKVFRTYAPEQVLLSPSLDD
jgi:hypothetical protein